MTAPQDFFDLPPAPASPAAGSGIPTPVPVPPRPQSVLQAVLPLLRLGTAELRPVLRDSLALFLAATGGRRGFLVRFGPEGDLRETCAKGLPAELSLSALFGREDALGVLLAGAAVRVAREPAVVAEALAPWGEAGRGVREFVCLRMDVGLNDARRAGVEPILPGADPTGPRGRLVFYADVIDPEGALVPRVTEGAREAGEVVRRALELREAMARLVFDPVTGLPGRGAFLHALSRSLANGPFPVSIFLCDLDGFRAAAREEGPAWQDATLRTLAEVLAASLPADAFAARYGGDEFAVVLPATSAEAAAMRAEGVHVAFTAAVEPLSVRGRRLTIGIATSADGKTEPHDLLRRADQAAAVGKQAGGNSWFAWSASLSIPHARVDRLAGLLARPWLDARKLGLFVELAGGGPTGGAAEVLTPRVLDLLGEALGARLAVALTADRGGWRLLRGRTAAGADLDPAVPVGQALVEETANAGRPMRFTGPEAELLDLHPPPAVSDEISIVCAPLLQAGRVVAVLYLETAAPSGFGASDQDYAEAVAGILAPRIGTPPRPQKNRKGPRRPRGTPGG